MAFFSAEAVRDFYFDSKTLRPEIIERADVNYVGSLKPLDLFMLSDGILPGRSRFLKIGDNMFALSRDGSDFVKVSPMNINSQMPSIELTAVDNSQYQEKQTFR